MFQKWSRRTLAYGFVTHREPQNREKGKASARKNAVKFGIFPVRSPNPILAARAVLFYPLNEFELSPENRFVKSDRRRDDAKPVPHPPGFGIDTAGIGGFATREEKTFFNSKFFRHRIASDRASAHLSKGENERDRREAWASCAEETELVEKIREKISRKKHRHSVEKSDAEV